MNPGKNEANLLKHFKNSLFEVYLKETNVLGVEVTQQMKYDKEDIEHIIDNLLYIAENKKYLVLFNTGPFTKISRKGLKLLIQANSMHCAHAKACVTPGFFQKLLANLYLFFIRPIVPVKFFRDSRDAETWLLKNYRQYMRTSEY